MCGAGAAAASGPRRLLDSLVDIGERKFDQLALGGATVRGPYKPTPAARRASTEPASGRTVSRKRRAASSSGPAGFPGQRCGTASARWGPWPAPCATSLGIAHGAALRQQTARSAGCRPLAMAPKGGPEQRLARSNHPARRILQAGLQIGIGLGLRRDGVGAREPCALCRPPHGQATRNAMAKMSSCSWRRMGRCEAAAGRNTRRGRQGCRHEAEGRVHLSLRMLSRDNGGGKAAEE